ncbi:MAG TPA: MFS transporter, partial [Streptomyces sp.]|nr:MFS transporter [Streptomyces sp.]
MDVKNGGPRRSSSKDAEAVVAARRLSHSSSASVTGPEGTAPHGGRLRLVLLLGSLVALGPLTTDMYLPALPAITSELHTSPAAVQLTLTGALAGLALGQLLVGPLSDAIGRRTPLLAGVSVHIIASALCLLAPNLAVLDVLRVLQGLGAATSTVITMAIVRDLFEDAAAAGLLSRLMLILGVSPILAPTLGGIVLAWSSWRGIFAV